MSTRVKNPLARYPARGLIFDFTEKWTDDVIQNIYSSLTNFLAVTAHLTGPSRIPLLAIFTSRGINECLYHLQPVKGNFTKLYRVIQELKKQEKGLDSCNAQNLLENAVTECFHQFERHIQATQQVARNNSFQIEITLLTTQNPTCAELLVQPCLQKVDLSLLKKINIVSVNASWCNLQNGKDTNSSDGSPGSSIGNMESSFIETCRLHNDSREIEQFFKSWLVESGADEVQLTIELPKFEGKDILLKCDLQERVINPIGIPSGHNLLLQTDLNYLPPGGMVGCKASVLPEQPKYHMKAKMLLKNDCICESIPFVILPTMCWKLDWEDLEANQQLFQSFCSYLLDKGLVLLVEGIPSKAVRLCSFFLVFPCDGNSLLIKSVAVRDLMMPFNGETSLTTQPKEITSAIENAMDMLNVKEEFNPLELSAGFTEQLLPPRENMKRKQERLQREEPKLTKTSSKYVPLFKPKTIRSKEVESQASCSLYGKNPTSSTGYQRGTSYKPRFNFQSPPDFPDKISID